MVDVLAQVGHRPPQAGHLVVGDAGAAGVVGGGVAHLHLEVDHLFPQLVAALAQVVGAGVAGGQRRQRVVEVGQVVLQPLQVARLRFLRRPGLGAGGKRQRGCQGSRQHGQARSHGNASFAALLSFSRR